MRGGLLGAVQRHADDSRLPGAHHRAGPVRALLDVGPGPPRGDAGRHPVVDARRAAAARRPAPLDPELTERLDSIRWTMRTGPLLDTLIGHLVDDLGEPTEILTSLDRLAAATGQDVDDVRLALAELVKSGDARVQRGEEPADAERLEAHRRFRLVMDWEHFHENRIQVSRGDWGPATRA